MDWQNYCNLLLAAYFLAYFLYFPAFGSHFQKKIYYTAPYDGVRKQIEDISLRIDVIDYRTSVGSWFILLVLGDVERQYNAILNGQASIWTFDDSLLGTLNTNSHAGVALNTHSLVNYNKRISLLEAKIISNDDKDQLYALNQRINEQDAYISELHFTKEFNKLASLQQRLNTLQESNLSARLNELEKRIDMYIASLVTKAAANELENNLIMLTERVSAYKQKLRNKNLPSNCWEAMNRKAKNASDIYEITIHEYRDAVPFSVYCDANYGGGWTVVQRRMHDRVDFNRIWEHYQHGFGDLRDDFFIGLDKLHALTAMQPPPELLLLLRNDKNEMKMARYTAFAIGDEQGAYVLKELGECDGGADDVLRPLVQRKFSTRDRDQTRLHCARVQKSAWWWLDDCSTSPLNPPFEGTDWRGFSDWRLDVVQMMLRPVLT